MSEWEKSLAPPEDRGDESPLATGLKEQKAE